MTQDSYELLRELATNDRFMTLLEEMSVDSRSDLMGSIHQANVLQNPTAAAMEFGKLDFLTNLPTWFSGVFRDNAVKHQSVR